MKTLLLLALAFISVGITAQANELDNEADVTNAGQRALAQNLPATLVVRVSQVDGSVAVLQSNAALDPVVDSATAVSANYVKSNANDVSQGELNQDSSTSGWYFYWNHCNYAAPTYYYYGYNFSYHPYYNYNYGSYYYYWYRWF